MHRHLKIFFILLPFLDLYPEKIPKIYFQTNKKYLNLSDVGVEPIIFTIQYEKRKEVGVKSFFIKILDSKFNILQNIKKNLDQSDQGKFIFIWDGKDQNKKWVEEGEYKAILEVEYTYPNLTKEFELTFYVIKFNPNFEFEFINPLIIIKNLVEQKSYVNLTEAKILNKNKNFDFYDIESYVIDPTKKILLRKKWNEKIKDTILWNGYVNDSISYPGIYHFLFKTKTKEKNLFFILPGILIFPHNLEYYSFLNHYIVNSRGFGVENLNFQPLQLKIKNKEWKEILSKNNLELYSKYYQIFCLEQGIFKSEWKFYKDGIEDITTNGILRMINQIPPNKNCQIVFFENPLREFEFLKINQKILTTIPIYVDTEKPEVNISFKKSFRPNSDYYDDYFQNISLELKDNTFLESINLKIFLQYSGFFHLVKEWNIPHLEIPHWDQIIKKDLNWYGDTIDNSEIYSLENFILELNVRDFAGNLTQIKKTFKTDIFFREHNSDFRIYIPTSNFFVENQQIISTSYLEQIIQKFKKSKKKYLYINIHFFNNHPFEDLKTSEKLSESIYNYIITKLPKEQVFYRGMGNLYPIYDNQDEFSLYKNNRIEILFSNVLLDREKL